MKKSEISSSTPPPPKREKKKGHRVEFVSPVNSERNGGAGGSSVKNGGGPSNGQSQLPHHAKLQSKESVDRGDKQRRLEMVARAKERREKMLKRIRLEKKIMLLTSILAFLALPLWFAAVFTDHWYYLIQSEERIDQMLNETRREDGRVFVHSNTGIWRTCQNFVTSDGQASETCSYFSLFYGRDDLHRHPGITLNEDVIDYTRVQVCFAFISVLLMTMTIVAAFYTFKNSRYVYKRLAACLYFMTTISMLVVLEVLTTSVNYSEGANLYPKGILVKYGFSYYMGWTVFMIYLVNGCVFLVLSRKRKGDKDDDVDGGQIMGR